MRMDSNLDQSLSSMLVEKQLTLHRMKNALGHLLAAMNPNGDDSQDALSTSCCICLSDMEPFQALFLAPCSHCFHYKCSTPLLASGYMFQCPLCRQVANLEADVAQDESSEIESEEEVIPLTRDMGGLTMARPRPRSAAMEIPSPPVPLAPSPRTAALLAGSLMTPPNHTRVLMTEEEAAAEAEIGQGMLSDPLARLDLAFGSLAPLDALTSPLSGTAEESGAEADRERLAQVLQEYELTMARMTGLFPGLTDEGWQERVAHVRSRLL